jgi:hypothetical protein
MLVAYKRSLLLGCLDSIWLWKQSHDLSTTSPLEDALDCSWVWRRLLDRFRLFDFTFLVDQIPRVKKLIPAFSIGDCLARRDLTKAISRAVIIS